MCSHDLKPVADSDRREALIADVTCAVYQVVLKGMPRSNWLDLQLALWHAVRSRLEGRDPLESAPSLGEGTAAWAGAEALQRPGERRCASAPLDG